jgi:DNA-binding NtrC family response regulator
VAFVIGATTKPKPHPAASGRDEDIREVAMIKLVSSRSAPCTNHEVSEEIIGRAPVFREALSRLPTLARADGTVLITGETGTGKELVARAVHALSPRAAAPFVAVNCGALVDTLLESELFGHERGAFTDAHTRRQGLVAEAAPGTLFLDELETLTPRAQVSLLRFLQDRSYRALGSAVEQRADVRCVAATNAQLDGLVRTGAFRADLYYRVSVFSVNLPPLRERREDIVPLAEHFVAKHATGAGPAPRLSPEAVDALLTCDWPGNVRELESAIARAMPVTRGDRIEARDLGLAPEPARARAGLEPVALLPESGSSYKIQKRRVVESFERVYLHRLMTDHHGNVSRAALAAGKERRDLGKLLKRHGLVPRQFAPGGAFPAGVVPQACG